MTIALRGTRRFVFWDLNVACFRNRPTHDLAAIYSTFVGCSVFEEAWKRMTKDSQEAPNNISKSMQIRFNNLPKNAAQRKTNKNIPNLLKMQQKGILEFPGPKSGLLGLQSQILACCWALLG